MKNRVFGCCVVCFCWKCGRKVKMFGVMLLGYLRKGSLDGDWFYFVVICKGGGMYDDGDCDDGVRGEIRGYKKKRGN